MTKILNFLKKVPQFVWFSIVLLIFWLLTAPTSDYSANDFINYQNKILDALRQNEANFREENRKSREEKRKEWEKLGAKLDTLIDQNLKTDKDFKNQLEKIKRLTYEASLKNANYSDSTFNSLLNKLRSE